MEWNDNYTWTPETTTLEEQDDRKSKEDASYESELAEKSQTL